MLATKTKIIKPKTPKKSTPDTVLKSQEKVVNRVVKATKGWRTVGVNAVISIPLIIEVTGQLLGLPEVKAIVPNEYIPIYAALIPVMNVILRFWTTTAVGKKQ